MSTPDIGDEEPDGSTGPPSVRTTVLTLAASSVAPLAVSWVVTALWAGLFVDGADGSPLSDGERFAVIPGWFALSIPAVFLVAAVVQVRRFSHRTVLARNPWIAALWVTFVITLVFVAALAIAAGRDGVFVILLWLSLCGYPVALYLCGVLAFRRLSPVAAPDTRPRG